MEFSFADFSAFSSMSGDKAEKNMDEAWNYLSLDLANIVKVIRPYNPLEVLKMAVWEERRIASSRKNQESKLMAHLLPVLLQSLVQSTLYKAEDGISANRDIKQKDWNRVLSLTEDAARRLLRYIDCRTVSLVRRGCIPESMADLLRRTLFDQIFPDEETMEIAEKRSYLWYGYVVDDSKAIQEKFGTDSLTLVRGMYAIAERGITGIDKLVEDVSMYKAEMLLMMAQKRGKAGYADYDDDQLRDAIVREEGWEMRSAKLRGERDGFDLFRPEFVADLPSSVYEHLAAAPGQLDLHEYLEKGVWPSTVYPFLKFGEMYFSFTAEHIMSYGIRILAFSSGLMERRSAAAVRALSSIFMATDVPDVYSFDGNRIDAHTLSSSREINAFESPELFAERIRRREEERHAKAVIGHKLLFVDPDSYENLKEESDGSFVSSVYAILKAARIKDEKTAFLHTIFGDYDLGQTELDEYVEDEYETEEKSDDDIKADSASDEYEYDSIDDDVQEKLIQEKEESLDEEELSEIPAAPSVDIEKLKEQYELTSDIISKDDVQSREIHLIDDGLEDDEYILDESQDDTVEDDEINPEVKAIYDEAEADADIENKDSDDVEFDDPDQLDFLDQLFADDEDDSLQLKAELTAEDSRNDINADDSESFDEVFGKSPSEEKAVAENDSAAEDVIEEENSRAEEDISSAEDEVPAEDDVPAAIDDEVLERKIEDAIDEEIDREDVTASDGEDPEPDDAEEEEEKELEDELEAEDEEETAESLIEKGLVKEVEGDESSGRVFMMTDPSVPEEEPEIAAPPVVEMKHKRLPGVIGTVAERLGYHGEFVSFAENSETDMLEYLEQVMKTSWEKQMMDGKDKMFSIFDKQLSVIIASSRTVWDNIRKEELLNNAGAVMYSRHAEKWHALVLIFDEGYELQYAEEIEISPSSFSPSNWKICTNIGELLIQRGK